MADITMCKSQDCPLRDTCYRYKAKASEYLQAYFTEPPYNKETGECPTYWGTPQQNIMDTLKEIFGED